MARYLPTYLDRHTPTMRILTLLSLFLMGLAVQAQDVDMLARVGWFPLPDSLLNTWRLPSDQVRRLRVIEEDYNGERVKLMAETGVTDAQREERLRELAASRRNEIRAVLPMRQFDDWVAAHQGQR
jgi:hypothetical protein